MNRRIEFTLNLDDPVEQAIYEALTVALRHRRAGEVIRQALKAFLFSSPANSGLTTGGIQRTAPAWFGSQVWGIIQNTLPRGLNGSKIAR